MNELVAAAKAELERRRLVAAAKAELKRRQSSGALIDQGDGALIEADGTRVPRAIEGPLPVTQPEQERFGDTLGYITEGPRQATGAFARGIFNVEQSPTNAVLPPWLQGTPRRTIAQAGDVAMTGISALGTAYAGAAGLAGEAFGGSRTGEQQLARDLLLAGQVAIPELATGVRASTQAFDKALKVAGRTETPRNDVEASARAADDLGVTPSLGMNGKLAGMTAAALEKVPFAGSIIARDAMRAVDDVEAAFYRITNKLGGARSPEQMGEALQAGGARYVERFQKRSARLYEEVGKHIPADTRIPLANAEAMVDELKSIFKGNPELARKLGANAWDGILTEARKNGGVSWAALTRFRSKVGQAIGRREGEYIGDAALGDLNQLYGALTADMEAAATAAGKPALDAFNKANDNYRRGSEKITKLLDKNASPERVFEAFTAMARADRTTSDVNRMQVIRTTMKSGEWRDVSASIVERLGRARPGQQTAEGDAFSPATFLTNWNTLSREAKTILLPAETQQELNKLGQIIERMKNQQSERNMSNTGSVVSGLAVAGGLGAAPVTTSLLLGGATVSAKALTSQPFLRALNRAARGDAKVLNAMANGNGPFKADAMSLLNLTAANQASNPKMPETVNAGPR